MAELAVVASMLKQLNLGEASLGLESIISEAALANETPLDVLEKILLLEIDGRNAKGKAKRLKAACFPYVEELERFDFERKGFKGINRAHIRQLTDLAWLEKAYNIMFLGPTGLGKTRLSIGLGLKAIEKGYSVAFITLDELMRLLKTSEISTSAARKVKAIKKSEMVILDEVGFLPISKQDANKLYEFVNSLYLRTSIVLTSNKSFEEWSEFIGDSIITAAILDRLAHQCEIFSLDGPSYRLENRKTIIGN
ncbi:MAG: ATP-binding protein [Tindallia sp. MSAO_Bac2]|nr:MAG: ATP-binding protein [Tindallia sp. MSAO_Bac2]